MQTAKQAAKQIINQMSDKASWDDIMYEFYVKQKIEKGLKAIEEDRTVSHEEAKKRLLDNKMVRTRAGRHGRYSGLYRQGFHFLC